MRNHILDTWKNMTNMRQRVNRLCKQNTNNHIHKCNPMCVYQKIPAVSACCYFFLLTSPEEKIMRQNEKEIKIFHKMITFQYFSKHFKCNLWSWCNMHTCPAWSNPLLQPSEPCPFISVNVIQAQCVCMINIVSQPDVFICMLKKNNQTEGNSTNVTFSVKL